MHTIPISLISRTHYAYTFTHTRQHWIVSTHTHIFTPQSSFNFEVFFLGLLNISNQTSSNLLWLCVSMYLRILWFSLHYYTKFYPMNVHVCCVCIWLAAHKTLSKVSHGRARVTLPVFGVYKAFMDVISKCNYLFGDFQGIHYIFHCIHTHTHSAPHNGFGKNAYRFWFLIVLRRELFCNVCRPTCWIHNWFNTHDGRKRFEWVGTWVAFRSTNMNVKHVSRAPKSLNRRLLENLKCARAALHRSRSALSISLVWSYCFASSRSSLYNDTRVRAVQTDYRANIVYFAVTVSRKNVAVPRCWNLDLASFVFNLSVTMEEVLPL